MLILLSASPDYFVTPVRLAVAGVGIGLFVVGGSALGKQLFGRNFDFSFWFSVTWLVLLGVAVAAAPWLPLGEHVDVANSLDQPLNAAPDPFSANPLGTNLFGLDLLARSVYGARSSLLIAMTAVVIGTVIGGAIGMVAGYFQKSVDRVIGIVTNSLLAVPPLILLIALATVLEPKIRNIAFALSLLTIPSMVRLARATTIVYAPREFVVAARALGATRGRILLRELLPNVLPPILSLAIVMISILIVAEASLSFLGLGIEPPEPTWGNMIAEGEGNVFEEYPHIVLVPGTFLFLTVFAFNLVGEKARRRWDPRSVKL
ncbi:Putative glutathione transporter, permease component [Alloactinosynnema sp. L-07]|nr:Putative glutathione transporter, permease component [Alloactinosynnema sp. L-07]